MVYKSATQEKFFMTRRVRVVSCPEYRSSYQSHRVIIHDVVADKITAVYAHGQWIETGDKPMNGSLYGAKPARTKNDAIGIAKETALTQQLPFDLKTDVIEESDLLKGIKRPCLSCDGEIRSKTPALCKGCQEALKVGRQAQARTGLKRVMIETRDLVDYCAEDYRESSEVLAELILKLGGFGWVGDTLYSDREHSLYLRSDEGHRVRDGSTLSRTALMTLDAADIGQQLIDLIARVTRSSFNKGQRDGAGFIKRMADGKLTVDEYNAVAAKIQLHEAKKDDRPFQP